MVPEAQPSPGPQAGSCTEGRYENSDRGDENGRTNQKDGKADPEGQETGASEAIDYQGVGVLHDIKDVLGSAGKG